MSSFSLISFFLSTILKLIGDVKGQRDKGITKDGWTRVRESISVTLSGGRHVATIGTMAGQVLLGLAVKLHISLRILLILSFICHSLLFWQFYVLHFSILQEFYF